MIGDERIKVKRGRCPGVRGQRRRGDTWVFRIPKNNKGEQRVAKPLSIQAKKMDTDTTYLDKLIIRDTRHQVGFDLAD